MITFKQHLINETKNTHLTHVEELVFSDGKKGVEDTYLFLKSLVEMLSSTESNSNTDVTMKYDGAPAVFAGIDPENGKFFVGSKSVFNKLNPKINYTPADIDRNHSGGLADTLKIALNELPSLGITGILQGDIMFTNNTLSTKKIDGENYHVFTPNTITYAVPTSSDLGRRISAAKIGIVFHTQYTGKSIKDSKASFRINLSGLKRTKSVWFTDAYVKKTNSIMLNAVEQSFARGQLGMMEKQMKTIPTSLLKDLAADKMGISSYIQIYHNTKVKSGDFLQSGINTGKYTADLFKFVSDKIGSDRDSRKTEQGKAAQETKRKAILQYMRDNSTGLHRLIQFQAYTNELKVLLVRKLEKVESIKSFIRRKDGYEVTNPEGFVAIDINDKAVKLIDRLAFSKDNFSVAKNWVKG